MIVKTQKDFDAALKAGESWIEICSPEGVWINVVKSGSATVTASGSATARAYGSATVTASGSATVRAFDSATVRAFDSATVTASGSATVTAYGSATVTAYGSATVTASGSATVTAFDSATVTAFDSATVTASGSATVTAYGSATVTASGLATVRASGLATVRAFDSATVTAFDSATVTASGSATVTAFDSATVRATPKVAIHLHSGRAKINGGVLIDHTGNLDNAADWCEYHGVKVSKAGIATLYKAVNDQWTTDRGTDYTPGRKPSAPDWRDDDECGGGLHFSPWPWLALDYKADATRFVEVGVKLADLRVISGGTPKAKAPRVVRACVAVDIDGKRVTS